MCFYRKRSRGSIDRQNRDIGGKPKFATIPKKWRWIFKQKQNTYAEKTKILKASIISHLIGYLFGLIEMILLVVGIISRVNSKILFVADALFYLFILLIALVVLLPNGISYEINMQKTYDYDWITYVQEALTQKSKRKCKIISIIDGNTCEIEFLLKTNSCKYRAETKVPVEIGDVKYATHFYHSIDENKPYWVVKNY